MERALTPALAGDLAHFGLGDVLQLLRLALATGRLELERPGERAELQIVRGRPAAARRSGRAVRTGDVLLHRRLLEPRALERALERQRREPGTPIGALLAGSGDAAPEAVAAAVEEVIRRVVVGLALWPAGRFAFEPGAGLAPAAVPLALDVDRLLLEAFPQADLARAGR